MQVMRSIRDDDAPKPRGQARGWPSGLAECRREKEANPGCFFTIP